MWRSHPKINRVLRHLAAGWFSALILVAAEYHGQVTFGGLPVPGATVTAARDDKKFVTTTNEQGRYSLTDLTDGHWSIEIKMLGFGAIQQDVVIAPGAPAGVWELKMLPLGQIKAQMEAAPTISGAAPIAARESQPQAEAKKASEAESVQEDLSRRAADGFLINGSINNGAASPFSQAAAFGNRRTGGRSLYNGGIGITFDNSALNARPFSLTGQDTPKAAYNRMTGLLALGGPLRIPHLLQNGPNVFVGYQWTRNRNA